ncbi:unnamed protein product [Protopolystoma xenopodis]|uniref:MORN repeat-containing protein n=1 Tax=Protopolystoma xenopodis TaxID=117903 RepID=A0A3S5CN68_9PLAT|nr:unnamed protein product [Protopolystoma xenopodis]
MRQGLGVRRSAPYGLASEQNRAVRAAQSQNSLPSAPDSERGWRGLGGHAGGGGVETGACGAGDRQGRLEEVRSGFVLRSSSCPSSHPVGSPSLAASSGYRSGFSSGSGSETGGVSLLGKKFSFRKHLFRRLRKQKSTGDLSTCHSLAGISTATSGGVSGGAGAGVGAGGSSLAGLFSSRAGRSGGSLRSVHSGSTTNSVFGVKVTGHAGGQVGEAGHLFHDEPLGPNVVETYSGQWNEDRRSGYGIAERSDGLRYEGEWFSNKKDGYGVTFLRDGSREEGRYKENLLVQALNKRSKLFMLRHSRLRDLVEEAQKKAQEAAREAQEKSAEMSYQR